jgi:hypothetical protein
LKYRRVVISSLLSQIGKLRNFSIAGDFALFHYRLRRLHFTVLLRFSVELELSLYRQLLSITICRVQITLFS